MKVLFARVSVNRSFCEGIFADVFTCVQVSESYESLQETMGTLDELDVGLGFAEAAVELSLVRPIVDGR